MIKLLGSGGSAEVYLTEHISLGVYRAVKRVRKDTSGYKQLINEVHILKNLRNPNIPIIYDIEEDEMYSYIIEEFIEGESLRAYRLSQSNIHESVIIRFALQICHLFQYLHQIEGTILYLDLKPDNILVKEGILKLIDFGTAICSNHLEKRSATFGTKGYASPEQYGMKHLDERSDIYSMGALLYFLVTGVEYWKDEETREKKRKQFPCSIKLQHIIEKCLKYNPSQRYQTMTQVEQKLKQMEKHIIVLQKKERRPSLTIAVAGSQNRIGTTHVSILLTSYFNHIKRKSIYIEGSKQGTVETIAEEYPNLYLKHGSYKIKNCFMMPYILGFRKELELFYKDYIKIIDYGVLKDENREDFLSADKSILVAGAKTWEVSYTRTCMSKLEEKDVVYWFNFLNGADYVQVENSLIGKSCMRVPYEPNPFFIKNKKEVKVLIESCLGE